MPQKQVTKVEITNDVFKEPIEVIKQLTSNVDNLKFTKVIQTYGQDMYNPVPISPQLRNM